MGKEITCKNCGWQWNTSDSEDYDKYVCHKCGFDNRTFYDSEPIGEHHSKGGRTISQTPAPKKDRIFGSKVNPKGSASSEKSASKIVLSEKIIDSLKKKLAENNNKKVSLNDLKAVYRRGLGAYSRSYRPTISGGRPNSRNAWAMARVNKFLEKAAGKKVKAAYVQDDDLLKYEDGGKILEKIIPIFKWKRMGIRQEDDSIKWVNSNEFFLWIYDDIEAEKKLNDGIYEYPYPTIYFNDDLEAIWSNNKFKQYNGNKHIISFIEGRCSKNFDKDGYRDMEIYVMTTRPNFRRKGVNEFAIKYLRDKFKLKKEQVSFYMPSEQGNKFILSDKYHLGGDMTMHLAPNGKPSNLNHQQWHLVRTLEFKAWFGDWENDPQNASKVVDENGEPMVVYHSTFNDFSNFKDGINYFAEDEGYSKEIAKILSLDRKSSDYVENRELKTIPVTIKSDKIYELPEGRELNENIVNDIISQKEFTDKYDAIKGVDLYSNNKIVYAVLDKSNIKRLDSKQSLKEKYEKGGLIAPNGKKSNLTQEQYKLVRTPEFKEWFGDWENEPLRASKVVDENGEPKVYYQGQLYSKYPQGNYLFKKNNNGIFFTASKRIAYTYGAIKSVFINSRNPKDIRNYYGYDNKKISKSSRNDNKYYYKKSEVKDYLNSDPNVIKFYEDVINKYGGDKVLEISDTLKYTVTKYKNKQEIKDFLIQTSSIGYKFLNFKFRSSIWDLVAKYIKNSKYDGVLATDEDYLGEDIADSVVVYNSNQIKLADGTNTTFDSANPDIRYDDGGLIKNEEFYKWFLDWYKNDVQGMTIMFTLPSEFTRLSNTSENDIILDVFQKNDNVDAKIYLQQIVDNADKYGVTLYVHPIPRTHRLMSEEHKNKITTDYLISYFEKFDFVIDADRFFMVRKPKVNYADGGITEFNKNVQVRVKEIKEDYKYDGSQKDLSYVNSSVAVAYLQYLAESIGEKYYQWDWLNESKEPTNLFQIDMMIEGGKILSGVFIYVDDNHKVVQSKSNVEILDDNYNLIKVLVQKNKLKSNISEYSFEYKGLKFDIIRFGNKWKFYGLHFGYFQSIPEFEAKSKNELIDRIKRYVDVIEPKQDYEYGGEITNACIEEVINIINSIQKVKDYYIHDGKLVIVFVEDLMVYGIDMINYHIGQFQECHDVIEPEAIVNDKENYKSIYFILKKDDATIGEFKEGGNVDLFGQIAGLMAKGTEYIEGYDENKRYILSADKEIYFKNQDNIDIIRGKPKGLWYSIGNSWAEYIYYEIPDKIDFYNYLYEIKVTNKIKIIDTIEEAIEFSKRYGDSNGYTTEGVDWGEVAKDYSGIEIKDPYNFSRIEYNQLFWMYGWDIPSGCIWDKSGIESIEFIQKSQSLYIEGGEIKSNTEKLISEIKKHSTITEGRVSTATDGSKYRYDNYVLKYPSTANWLVNLFEKAAQENNKKNATQFSYKDKYSISFQRPKFKGEPNGKIIMSELVELDGQFKEGGEVENKETYAKWKSLVNMSSSELERFYNSEEGKKAGLTPQQAKNEGIDSGRESARMILKMKDTKVSDWTPNMWRWAKKQISFISRMSGVKGSLYDDKGNKTRKHLALLIWGNNPEKKNNGGYITDDLQDLLDEYRFKLLSKDKNIYAWKKSLKGEDAFLIIDFNNNTYALDNKEGKYSLLELKNLFKKERLKQKSYSDGGEINNQKNINVMENVKFNGLPHIDTISDNDLILIKEEVFVGDIDKPMHKGTRYVSCKVMSKGGMVDSLNLKVIKSVGANALSVGQTITRPIANLVSNGRKMINSYKDGGELNPDNKAIKQYFAHDSGNAGGVLVGKRHSEGGIKATNNSTGQPIEMEGGEVVITRGAVSNPKKYSFEGKDMTTREVLSKLNVDGGGISFADGGDVPEKMNCGCSTMKLGGETMSTQDFITLSENEYQDIRLREGIQKEKKDHYSTLSKLNSGAITIEDAFREIAQKEMLLDSKYPFVE